MNHLKSFKKNYSHLKNIIVTNIISEMKGIGPRNAKSSTFFK